jgi:hypothetical protein
VKLARFRGQKQYVFSHIWNIGPIKIQQYYEKQVMLRRGHVREREDKKEKVKR